MCPLHVFIYNLNSVSVPLTLSRYFFFFFTKYDAWTILRSFLLLKCLHLHTFFPAVLTQTAFVTRKFTLELPTIKIRNLYHRDQNERYAGGKVSLQVFSKKSPKVHRYKLTKFLRRIIPTNVFILALENPPHSILLLSPKIQLFPPVETARAKTAKHLANDA